MSHAPDGAVTLPCCAGLMIDDSLSPAQRSLRVLLGSTRGSGRGREQASAGRRRQPRQQGPVRGPGRPGSHAQAGGMSQTGLHGAGFPRLLRSFATARRRRPISPPRTARGEAWQASTRHVVLTPSVAPRPGISGPGTRRGRRRLGCRVRLASASAEFRIGWRVGPDDRPAVAAVRGRPTGAVDGWAAGRCAPSQPPVTLDATSRVPGRDHGLSGCEHTDRAVDELGADSGRRLTISGTAACCRTSGRPPIAIPGSP